MLASKERGSTDRARGRRPSRDPSVTERSHDRLTEPVARRALDEPTVAAPDAVAAVSPGLRARLTGRSRPAAGDQPVVVLHDVTMRYPNGKEALKDVELVVPEGDFVFLVGPSGAGKSTLTKLLIRDELATRAVVIVDGDDLAGLSRQHAWQKTSFQWLLVVVAVVFFVLLAVVISWALVIIGSQPWTQHFTAWLLGGKQSDNLQTLIPGVFNSSSSSS